MAHEQLCRTLRGQVDEIAQDAIARWKEMVRLEPWAQLPEELDHDHLPDVITHLLEGCGSAAMDYDSLKRGVAAAAQHGEHRAEQGFDESLIFREYAVLRKVLNDWLARVEPDTGERVPALVRIDAGITLLSGASLRGLYRKTLEQSGEWEGLLERYLQDFRLPQV